MKDIDINKPLKQIIAFSLEINCLTENGRDDGELIWKYPENNFKNQMVYKILIEKKP